MTDKLKRAPRKYWAAYIGHGLQGFICGLFMPLVWLPFLYCVYQCSEYAAYYLRNKDHAYTAGDMVSRDVADFMVGYGGGSAVTIGIGLTLLLILL